MSFFHVQTKLNHKTILLAFIFSLILPASHALAKSPIERNCVNSPTIWENKQLPATLHDIFIGDKISAKQGILANHDNAETTIYMSHGYTDSNMSKIAANLTLLRKAGSKKNNAKQPLLSDLAITDGLIAWTSYRSTSIILTDMDLNELTRIDLGKDYQGLVGIDAIAPRIFAVLSRSKAEISIINISSNLRAKVSRVKLTQTAKDAYDIASNGKCFIIVYRSSGIIKQGWVSDLIKLKNVELQPFANELQTPQHAEFLDEKLFIIETNAEQISAFDAESATKTTYALPHSIFRGMTLINHNRVLLTGFIRESYQSPSANAKISESRTGIFDFRLN